jgi:hypothetical protein
MNYKFIIAIIISHFITLFVALLFMVVVLIITGTVASEIYNMRHAIPDPVERGEDLGLAFVGIYYSALSLIPSSILSIWFYKSLFKKIVKFIRRKV